MWLKAGNESSREQIGLGTRGPTTLSISSNLTGWVKRLRSHDPQLTAENKWLHQNNKQPGGELRARRGTMSSVTPFFHRIVRKSLELHNLEMLLHNVKFGFQHRKDKVSSSLVVIYLLLLPPSLLVTSCAGDILLNKHSHEQSSQTP